MKLMMEPIDVVTGVDPGPRTQDPGPRTQDPRPRALCWRGRLFEVETVLEEWTARGHWWGKEDSRAYFLLMTSNGVLEIFKGSEGWMLSRIFD